MYDFSPNHLNEITFALFKLNFLYIFCRYLYLYIFYNFNFTLILFKLMKFYKSLFECFDLHKYRIK
jgi:hypothetical protein